MPFCKSRDWNDRFLVDLITNDNFEIDAFNLQVLKALNCSCAVDDLTCAAHDEDCACRDGGEYKLVADDEVSIVAVFTKESLRKAFTELMEEDDSMPDFNKSLIIIRKYDVLFMPNNEKVGYTYVPQHDIPMWQQSKTIIWNTTTSKHTRSTISYTQIINAKVKCKFQLRIDEFVLRCITKGFSSKYEIIDIHETNEVKTKLDLVWNIWRRSSDVSLAVEAGDDTLHSIGLTQLLEEMDIPLTQDGVTDKSIREDRVTDGLLTRDMVTSTRPEGREAHTVVQPISTDVNKRVRPLPKSLSSVFNIEDFIISEEDQSILVSLEEWKPGYRPPAIPSTSGEEGNASQSKGYSVMSAKRSPNTKCNDRRSGSDKSGTTPRKNARRESDIRCRETQENRELVVQIDVYTSQNTSPKLSEERNIDIDRNSVIVNEKTSRCVLSENNLHESPNKYQVNKHSNGLSISQSQDTESEKSQLHGKSSKSWSPTKVTIIESDRQLRSHKRQRDSFRSLQKKRVCVRNTLDESVTEIHDASPQKEKPLLRLETDNDDVNPENDIQNLSCSSLVRKRRICSALSTDVSVKIVSKNLVSSEEQSDKSQAPSSDDCENDSGPMASTQIQDGSSQKAPSFDEWLSPKLRTNLSPKQQRSVKAINLTTSTSKTSSSPSAKRQSNNSNVSTGFDSTTNVGQYLQAVDLSTSLTKSPWTRSQKKKMSRQSPCSSNMAGHQSSTTKSQPNSIESTNVVSEALSDTECLATVSKEAVSTETQPFSVSSEDSVLVLDMLHGDPVIISSQSPPGIVRFTKDPTCNKSMDVSTCTRASDHDTCEQRSPHEITEQSDSCHPEKISNQVLKSKQDHQDPTCSTVCDKGDLSTSKQDLTNRSDLRNESSSSNFSKRSIETPINSLPSYQPQRRLDAESPVTTSGSSGRTRSDDSYQERPSENYEALIKFKDMLKRVEDSTSEIGLSLLKLKASERIVCKYKNYFAKLDISSS